MAYSDFQRSRDACMSVCVCLCVSKYAFGCYLYHMYVNISRTNIVRCTCDISSSLKSHSIYASRIYLSISTCVCLCAAAAAYVLVYCDEHSQLAQKVIDFWGDARNQKTMEMEWNFRRQTNRNVWREGREARRILNICTVQSSTVTFKRNIFEYKIHVNVARASTNQYTTHRASVQYNVVNKVNNTRFSIWHAKSWKRMRDYSACWMLRH